MRISLASLALSLALALPGLSFGPASAQDLELHLGDNGPKIRLRDDCNPYRENCRDRRGDRRDRHERRSDRRECTPDRALDKAERMGIRRGRIDHVGRRTIDVRGRTRHGDRIVVTFSRDDRRCSVLR